MDALPPLPWPVPDPRAHHFVNHYSDMHALVAELVLPEHAPAYVVSVLETSRELIRHSYYRYEFTTVAVAYSLFALERALAERLGAKKKTLQQLIEQAAATGVITADLADRLDAGRPLRNKFAHGDLTGSALTPAMAVGMVRTAFDTAELLFPAPAGAAAVPGRAGTAQA
ncbi:DUF4145 domain-containing protein [Kitasatospora sp. NPDC005856]|uniref:DUF4145 domain-containing protein n=1 Tax=Kitasatospora sp. NPDC005856 TaxID=3154566 RepID=UPI0033DC2268